MLPRLPRILFPATAASAFLLLASAFFFYRSYSHQEWILLVTRSPARGFTIGSFPGRLDLGFDQETTPPPPRPGMDGSPLPLSRYPRWTSYSGPVPRLPPHLSVYEFYLPQGVPVSRFLGFVWINHSPTPLPGNCSYSLMIPYPCLLLLFALTPALWLLTRHRRRQKDRLAKQGLCPTCAYDLRAHHPGQKCPECATPIPQPPTPKSAQSG